MALQLYLTEVFNSETWKIAAEQTSRGHGCISLTYPRDDLETHLRVVKSRTTEVENWMFNTVARKEKYDALDEFTTSFGLKNTNVCDLDSKELLYEIRCDPANSGNHCTRPVLRACGSVLEPRVHSYIC